MRTPVLVTILAVALSQAIPAAGQSADLPRVVVIGIDGLGSRDVWRDTLEGVSPPDIPNITSLMATGAYTLNARIDAVNLSGPNWLGMLTGSPSSVHGVEDNRCSKGAELPTIFDILHDTFPERMLAIVHEWNRLPCYYQPMSVGLQILTHEEQETARWVSEILADDRVILIFAHFNQLDVVGHEYGSLSTEYKERMESIDREIGRILQSIRTTPGADASYVILTSDHGHRPEGGDHSSAEEPVPFIVHGPGVTPGEISASVRNNQLGPIVAHIFGVAPSPAWSTPLAPFDAIVAPPRR